MAGYPGKQGRKPVPTPLKILRGNPGKRPLNDAEPAYAARLPRPPDELSDGAKAEWRRTGKKLLAAGVFTEVDVAAFAAYCASYARWLEAQALLKKSSVLIKSDEGGLRLNPLLRIVREAQEEFTRALTEFGMSPSSRSRIKAALPAKDDSIDALLG